MLLGYSPEISSSTASHDNYILFIPQMHPHTMFSTSFSWAKTTIIILRYDNHLINVIHSFRSHVSIPHPVTQTHSQTLFHCLLLACGSICYFKLLSVSRTKSSVSMSSWVGATHDIQPGRIYWSDWMQQAMDNSEISWLWKKIPSIPRIPPKDVMWLCMSLTIGFPKFRGRLFRFRANERTNPQSSCIVDHFTIKAELEWHCYKSSKEEVEKKNFNWLASTVQNSFGPPPTDQTTDCPPMLCLPMTMVAAKH